MRFKLPVTTVKNVQQVNSLPEVRRSKMWDLATDGVTYSMLDKFMSCKELFNLAYVDGWAPSKYGSEPMEFGTCIHELLDIIYSYVKEEGVDEITLTRLPKAIRKALQEYYDYRYEFLQVEGGNIEALNKNCCLADVMLPAYFDFWKEDWFNIDWVALEEVFDIPIEVDGFTIRIRGKVDGIMRIKNRLWLFETKTKGRVNEEAIIDKLPIDFQVNLYLWAMTKMYGETPAGVYYNIIKRPGLYYRKNEKEEEYAKRVKADIADDPEKYFIRTVGSVAHTEIDEWEKTQFIPVLRALKKWYEGEEYFKNVSHCLGSHFPCAFLPICGHKNTGLFVKRKEMFTELKPISMKNIE